MLVSIEYVESDPTEELAALGIEVRDWEEEMQLCVVSVPTKEAEAALTQREDERGWFVNWRYERYHEFAIKTFCDIVKKVCGDATPEPK